MLRIIHISLILILLNSFLIAQCWKKISCSEDYSLAIQEDGTLWAWGWNTGNMGLRKGGLHLNPVKTDSTSDWINIFAGRSNSYALKIDGSLWGCGKNQYGQLGIGRTASEIIYNWTKIPSDTGWVKVSQGRDFNIGLKVDGTIWAWGYNRDFVLGDGTDIDKNSPTKIGNDNDWLDIAASLDYTIALKKDGSIWGWGQNDQGWLGDGSKIDRPTPVRIGTLNSFKSISGGLRFQILIKNDGTLWGWGSNYTGALNLDSIDEVKSLVKIDSNKTWKKLFISSKTSSGGAITQNGKLFIWGSNLDGQLGSGKYEYRTDLFEFLPAFNWKEFCTSTTHGMYLTEDGYLYTTGKNLVGQLGDGTIISRNTPINIPCNIINNISSVHKYKPTVYPNPFNEIINVENIEISRNYKIKLISLNNIVLFSSDLFKNEIVLPSYKSGIYILNIYNDNESYNLKIVKF